MKQYLDVLKRILYEGRTKHNRTGVDTLSISGTMLEFDMSTGKFPLLTTKKMGLKTIFSEVEMFIKGITSKKFLQDRKSGIWNAWCNPQKVPYSTDPEQQKLMAAEDDLGPIYGFNGNYWDAGRDYIITVEPRIKEKEPAREFVNAWLEDGSSSKYPLIGQIFETEHTGLKYSVTDYNETDDNNHEYYDIIFYHTGAKVKHVRKDHIQKGKVKDPYEPAVFGIGYRGNEEKIIDFINTYGKKIYDKLLKAWGHMIERCYNKNCKQYPLYGGNGIFVSNDWHDFSKFIWSCIKLPGWVNVLRHPTVYDIDKDYYGSNCYSEDTCVWLTHDENVLYAKAKPFIIIEPDGTKHTYISTTKCTADFGFKPRAINSESLKRGYYKNYKLELINDDKLYRYKLPINQLQNVINTLKTDPTCRRMIVSYWNPALMPEMALPPCHYCYEFVSDGESVDLLFNMRSVDCFLGMPFDIAHYAMLLLLICKQVKMKPGKLIGFFADTHIYVNHLDQVKEQLTRTPYESPVVKILNADDPNWTIWDWKYTDFELENYNCYPAIKAPVAV